MSSDLTALEYVAIGDGWDKIDTDFEPLGRDAMIPNHQLLRAHAWRMILHLKPRALLLDSVQTASLIGFWQTDFPSSPSGVDLQLEKKVFFLEDGLQKFRLYEPYHWQLEAQLLAKAGMKFLGAHIPAMLAKCRKAKVLDTPEKLNAALQEARYNAEEYRQWLVGLLEGLWAPKIVNKLHAWPHAFRQQGSQILRRDIDTSADMSPATRKASISIAETWANGSERNVTDNGTEINTTNAGSGQTGNPTQLLTSLMEQFERAQTELERVKSGHAPSASA
ncbi:hypothetical protein NCC49_005193 [Naganishia albida]|nr:hypothetical protein NCC49_005193 [Naganishia albida]